MAKYIATNTDKTDKTTKKTGFVPNHSSNLYPRKTPPKIIAII